MTKPDDGRWTPEEMAEVAKRRDAITDKLMNVIRQEDPRGSVAWYGVLYALSDLIISVVMSMTSEPRKVIDMVAADLKQAVHAKLGGRETEH
jgi:hypothetical protein